MTASNQSITGVSESMRSTEEWEMELGRAVKKLRIQRRLTQEEFAKSANLSLSALRNLESGRGSTLRSLILATRSLGRTDWLGSLTPSEPKVSPMELLRQRERAQKPKRRYRRKETSS